MKLTLTLSDERRLDEIITNLRVGRSERPVQQEAYITGYWKHHLAQIAVEKINATTVRVSGESGFYFPGMTYSGLDLINTLFKRYGQMRWIKGTRYDLSIPQGRSQKLGYRIGGAWLSFDFLRSLHHAHLLIENAEKNGYALPDRARILEIGSGTGIQALVFKLLFPYATYFLVDFPETLALASVFLSVALPKSKMLFFDEWRKNPSLLSSGTYDFVFIPNYAVDTVPSDSIHAALNTVSMQEMNYATIEMYFKEMRRILTGPSLFYQCNRDKNMDGVMIKLSEYPYRSGDVHLYRDRDEFFKSSIMLRTFLGRFRFMRQFRWPILKRGSQMSYVTRLSK